jgi:hypothetical protein
MVFELPRQPEVEQGQVLYKVQSHATKKALESQAIVQLTNFGPTYIAEKSPLRANVDEACIKVHHLKFVMFPLTPLVCDL